MSFSLVNELELNVTVKATVLCFHSAQTLMATWYARKPYCNALTNDNRLYKSIMYKFKLKQKEISTKML